MFQTFEQAKHFVAEQNIQVIDLKFCDLWGRWHHITIPSSQFEPRLMEEGIGFDGSSVGLKSVKAGDMVMVPDLGTAFIDPFWETPTLSFICRTLEADTHEIFANDPRNVAIRAEEYMKSTGIADESRWGPEFEFYIFDSVSYENDVNRAGYTIECREADWNSHNGGHGHYIPLHGGYHAIPPKDQLYKMRTRIMQNLEKMGVSVKYHHHEVGGPGQCEIETPMMSLLQAGDATMIIKYVTKMTAHENGQTVTFMPKPLFGEAGSGMHFHQHLFKAGKNAFYDAAGYGCLSREALYYVGGLLKSRIARVDKPIHQFLSSSSAGLRSPGQCLLLARQSQRRSPHPEVRHPARYRAHGIPSARRDRQCLLDACRAINGRSGWNQEPHRPHRGWVRSDRRKYLRLER
jgi:glutamine synthetase